MGCCASQPGVVPKPAAPGNAVNSSHTPGGKGAAGGQRGDSASAWSGSSATNGEPVKRVRSPASPHGGSHIMSPAARASPSKHLVTGASRSNNKSSSNVAVSVDGGFGMRPAAAKFARSANGLSPSYHHGGAAAGAGAGQGAGAGAGASAGAGLSSSLPQTRSAHPQAAANSTPRFASPLKPALKSTQSARFSRDIIKRKAPTPLSPPATMSSSRRNLLTEPEGRVLAALSSKRLASQRQRRLQIKGDSYRDVLQRQRQEAPLQDADLPSYPKLDADRALIMSSLQSHFLMASIDEDELQRVARAMKKVYVVAGTVVVHQGDEGDNFYVIDSGDFAVSVDGAEVAELSRGNNFGDLALLYNCPRAATVAAIGDGVLWSLSRRVFRTIVLRATSKAIQDTRKWLRRVSMLRPLPASQINRLADALQPVRFQKGDTIIREGEAGDVFYLIKTGSVTVSQRITEAALQTPADLRDGSADEPEELKIMDLGEGEHFGERALLTKDARAATVTARTDVVLLALDRPSFEELLGPVENLMELTHSQRRLAAARVHLEREESVRTMRMESQRRLEIGKVEEAGEESKSAPTSGAGAGGDAGAGARAHRTKKPICALHLPPRKLRTDCVLENLRPLAVLGEGAFGVVQLVEHVTTGEVFALKQMQKARIVKTGQQRNVCNEKKLLAATDHPYILTLYNAFKDKDCLYLVLEFLQGGDMFGHLYKQGGKFDSPTSIFYAATVLTVFEHLHTQNIVYRDLKPENLVLDSRGYLKVVDFGFAKEVKDRTYTLCGTPEYLAPELVQGHGHNKMVDYWALGILIYEMLQGYSPFADDENNNQLTVYKNIIRGQVVFSSRLRDATGINLIMSLLVANPMQRLGSGRRGAKDVMDHAWFKRVNWAGLMKKRVLPPIIPHVRGVRDVSNFDEVNSEGRKIVPYVDKGDNWDADF